MKIILDFDYTLFNTGKFREAVMDAFSKNGVDNELFSRTLEESRGEGRNWKPYIQFDILESLDISDIDLLRKDFDVLLKSSCLFLYEDTLPFLEKIRKDHSLALLTYGEDFFQGAKLAGCDVATKYFERVVITKNIYKDKETNDLSGGSKAIFVDDNPAALSAVKIHAPHIVTVRINRGDGRYAHELSLEGTDYEVADLKGVEGLIPNL